MLAITLRPLVFVSCAMTCSSSSGTTAMPCEHIVARAAAPNICHLADPTDGVAEPSVVGSCGLFG